VNYSLIERITNQEKTLFGGMSFQFLGGFIEMPLSKSGCLLVG